MNLDDLSMAENIHKDFVDSMYNKFGLNYHPGYCLINIKPIISNGGFYYGDNGDPDIIVLNDVLLKSEVKSVTCHESSHFLHPFARQIRSNIKARNRVLGDIIAELGCLIYLKLKEDTNEIERIKTISASYYPSQLALDIFERDEELLTEISQIDMRAARKLFLKFLKRTLYDRR